MATKKKKQAIHKPTHDAMIVKAEKLVKAVVAVFGNSTPIEIPALVMRSVSAYQQFGDLVETAALKHGFVAIDSRDMQRHTKPVEEQDWSLYLIPVSYIQQTSRKFPV